MVHIITVSIITVNPAIGPHPAIFYEVIRFVAVNLERVSINISCVHDISPYKADSGLSPKSQPEGN